MSYSEPQTAKADDGEFLWLVSLSDLMILLFVFFVVMFSFAYKKMKQADLKQMVAEITNKATPPNPMVQVGEQFKKWVADQKLDQLVDVQRKNDSVVMEIKDQLLFNSGEFSLKQDGTRVAQSLRMLLQKVPPPFKIGIEGHTDDSALYSNTIRDNWELAGKRALSVFYALSLDPVTQHRVVIMSLGPMDPLVPDRDAHGNPIPLNQAKNRRVTLRIFQ
jgi:chemotaxis protein MotB